MFKPNRVGTPVIAGSDTASSIAALAPTFRDADEDTFSTNFINAAPGGEYAQRGLNWKNVTAVANQKRFGLALQFTVSQPIAGDTIGFEISFGLQTIVPQYFSASPVVGRVNAGSGLFSSSNFVGQPTPLDSDAPYIPAAGTVMRQHYALRQVIFRATNPTVGGTYAAGYQFFNLSGSSFNFYWFNMHIGVRQLNYQETVGYRDTLR